MYIVCRTNHYIVHAVHVLDLQYCITQHEYKG